MDVVDVMNELAWVGTAGTRRTSGTEENAY